MLLFLAGDVRWSGQMTEQVQFLGRTLRFSTTWIVLASLSEAPVVMVYCRIGQDRRYHLDFHPPFVVPIDAPQKGQTGYWVQHFMRVLEQQIRLHPTNSNDYLFWSENEHQVA
jgi:KDO2-lipid IV(A) lauroyltransferase